MQNQTTTISYDFEPRCAARARKLSEARQNGRVPRAARMVALAIKIDGLVRQGLVRDYADVARLGNVSRARVTQLLDLTLLAPDIQEAILDLPPIHQGRERIKEWQLRRIAAEPDWEAQREMWRALEGESQV